MAAPNPEGWPQRVAVFSCSPSHFLSSTTPEDFLSDLLQDLKDDKVGESTKVLMLGPLQEHPTILCPSQQVGEQTAATLLGVFSQMAHTPKYVNLKCHLMLSIATVIISTSVVKQGVKVAEGFLDLLFQTAQDTNDQKHGGMFRPLRAMACDCLREVETCCPGLLSHKLEALYSLKQQEITPLHQAYTLLYGVALRNAVHCLTLQKDVMDGDLKKLLASNEGFAWKTTEKPLELVPLTTMSRIPVLPSNVETKELKSVVSLLLEECYLLTPVTQAALLRELTQVVSMVQSLSPAIFKSQLLRLFGTMEISLLHSTLQMKGTFTDSLFTAEDENFLLKRLVGMAQHPLLSTPQKLFYIECILHFPENRPISSNGEESLPVLVTPRMAASLFPTVFNDSRTMLSRLNILSLVYLEADEEEGIDYIFDHLMALHKIVDHHGTREMTTTFFRAVYIFMQNFYLNERYTRDLIESLSELYRRHYTLAPNLINLVDSTQKLLEDSSWPTDLLKALQVLIVELPLQQLIHQSLYWHLKVLGRVAKEEQASQRSTVRFLLNLLINSSLCGLGDWRIGNALLSVCRNLLQHPNLDHVFIELADLLQFMMHSFEDVDIQDHARFYYTLLTNLSKEKLSGVLNMGTVGSQAKIRSLSSIMAESEELSSCLTVHRTRQPVLKLVKLSEDNISEVDALYHKLFCICLHFEQTDSNYERVSDVSVPCLIYDRKPCVVSLTLKPWRPYPTVLHASAIFTTEDGLSWHTQLDPIPIGFPDLFLPLPVPVHWSQGSREQLFHQLWNSLSPEESSPSATSLFCFEVGERSLKEVIESSFHQYLVSKEANPESYKVLLFLPPQFYVLLKIENSEDAASVSIITDNWKLLPFINSYIKCITDYSADSTQ
ncbi:AP5B1 protein, partial [Polyodon spathula]|nr:AP5B1 protein [Polyodon spathula]